MEQPNSAESCFDFESVKSERREIDRRFRDLVPSAFITRYIFPTSSAPWVTSSPTGREHYGQCSSEVFCLCGWPSVPWIDTFIVLDSFFFPFSPILVKAKSHSVTLRWLLIFLIQFIIVLIYSFNIWSQANSMLFNPHCLWLVLSLWSFESPTH